MASNLVRRGRRRAEALLDGSVFCGRNTGNRLEVGLVAPGILSPVLLRPRATPCLGGEAPRERPKCQSAGPRGYALSTCTTSGRVSGKHPRRQTSAFIERETSATPCGARTLFVQRSQSCERVSVSVRAWMREKPLSRINELQRVPRIYPWRQTSSFIERETPAPPRRASAGDRPGGLSHIAPCRISQLQGVSGECECYSQERMRHSGPCRHPKQARGLLAHG
jgi:hypothetical protein